MKELAHASSVQVVDVWPPTCINFDGRLVFRFKLSGPCGCPSKQPDTVIIALSGQDIRGAVDPVVFTATSLENALLIHAYEACMRGVPCALRSCGMVCPPSLLRRTLKDLCLSGTARPRKGKRQLCSRQGGYVTLKKSLLTDKPQWTPGAPWGPMEANMAKKAKQEILGDLKYRAKMDRAKAGQLISHLAKQAGVDPLDIIGESRISLRDEWAPQKALLSSARDAIKRLTGHKMTNDQHATVGTFLSTVCPPVSRDDAVKTLVKQFDMGRAHRSQYVKDSCERRHVFNEYVELHGDETEVPVGMPCRCRAGEGTLISTGASATNEDGVPIGTDVSSCVVKIHDTGLMVVFKATTRMVAGEIVTVTAVQVGRIRPWQPSLAPDLAKYNKRSRRPLTIKASSTIEKWHRENNYVSPNVKDIRRLRLGYNQYLEERAIYRMQTWNELWRDFVLVEPELSSALTINSKTPNEHPTIFRSAAPWCLVKGLEESCLCDNCERMNAIKRGQKHVFLAI